MNSEERREARYQRRKAKREEKKAIRNADHTFQKVTEFGSLRKSFTKRGEELTGKLLYKNMDATCLEIHTSLAVKCGNIKR